MIDILLKDYSFIALMLPIIACSYLSIAIIIERSLSFASFKKYKAATITRIIFDFLINDQIQEAVTVCEKNPYFLTNILKAGIGKMKHSKEVVKEAMENASLYEVPGLEKNLSSLSTLAHISPLLGLLGTVVGLVKSFYVIYKNTGSAGVINPSDIAGGIWMALLTTVAGLCVAIISYIAYNYFVHRVNFFVLEVERASTELLEIILEKA